MRAAFAAADGFTVGFEDELMLLDPTSFELAPAGPAALELLDGDPRFKLELPASQLEIVTEPSATVPDAVEQLRDARATLVRRAGGLCAFAAAGVHPTSPGVGLLNQGERYDRTARAYGPLARRQLVCALQVHVAVGDADTAIAVYNAARSYLPLIAALAANAPFYEGRDTGLASVRPKIGELLPRQGVPPALESVEQLAGILRWGAASRAFPSPHAWWWELRPHALHGTLEFRVPDGQTTVEDAGALAAVVQALVAWLAERHESGERLPFAESWTIAENRWSACRSGVEGELADLQTGELRPTSERLNELLSALAPTANRLGAQAELEHAGRMVAGNGAIAQRAVAESSGIEAVAPWLAARFSEQPGG